MAQNKYKTVAVVGGGIAGLTAALRLVEQGYQVDLYEAAPALGGRTKSFFDKTSQSWIDNGPHLMVGAYTATRRLLADVGASHHVSWQASLTLPLWDKQRGLFAMSAPSWLPVSIALILAVAKMPNHGLASVKAMLKLALTMTNRSDEQTVAQWLEEIKAPDMLIQDMLEVLCLGVMNEPIETANAKTFARVLGTSFSSHENAKMGWFNKPLSQALIEPVATKVEELGVNIHLKHTIRDLAELNHDAVVLAVPAFARNRLLGIQDEVATKPITNVHFWFDEQLTLPSMMLGMLNTYSQWLFDMGAMTKQGGLCHLCVTVSADKLELSQDEVVQKVLAEIETVLNKQLPKPVKSQVIREKRATVLVRPIKNVELPNHVFDACEAPTPGQLPATIELAVISGESAAKLG
ncbi:MAG: FAD-dependent oxidoreductase [Ghiorsea sp.]